MTARSQPPGRRGRDAPQHVQAVRAAVQRDQRLGATGPPAGGTRSRRWARRARWRSGRPPGPAAGPAAGRTGRLDRRCLGTFRRAQRTAAGSMSVACTSARSTAAAIAAPIAPAPQHRSTTMSPGRASVTACWTRNSVRRRGTKTPASTAIRSPQNSAQPMTCSSGRPPARCSTMAPASAGVRAADISSLASSSAKTQPAARSRATTCDSSTPVTQIHDPGAERSGLEQVQRDLPVQRREVRRAAAHHDRADEQPVFIDEVELDQAGGQAARRRRRLCPRPAGS